MGNTLKCWKYHVNIEYSKKMVSTETIQATGSTEKLNFIDAIITQIN